MGQNHKGKLQRGGSNPFTGTATKEQRKKLFYSPSLHFPEWSLKNAKFQTPLVVQWVGVHLPMQGTQVPSVLWEDPTCHRATKALQQTPKPVLQSLRAAITQPTCCSYWSPLTTEPVPHKRSHGMHCNARAAPAPCKDRKPTHSKGDRAAAKNKNE